ncbi:hypothetical protein ASD00_32660 [Ensifer sp. Root31]|uniref:LysR family transcriptional regulator n=1 Tax=Ensifer sp. Root31 TaxID=1736512 RepID=UPI00070CC172|nr:LysR family transcriptional regulator [Ensifer sp. Root31]KQU85441.1 hypothetical protein ASD00_32660 [Ensifer sp. Root31]
MDHLETLGLGAGRGDELEKKLAGVDLNLLVALEMLLHYRNVTHAARQLGQTQPTMSRALARLRDLLGDDLLVRSSTGMILTARGEHLARIVPTAMTHVREVLSARQAISDVRISITATLMPALLPHFMQWASRENDLIKVNMHKFPEEGFAALRAKSAQFTLGSPWQDGTYCEFERAAIAEEDFVTLVSFDIHRVGGARPSEEAFLALPHISLVENGRELFPQVPQALLGAGIRRSRLIDIPDITSAALMAAENGYALTVPRAIAGWLTKTLRLAALVPPLEIASHQIELCWRKATSKNQNSRVIDDIQRITRAAIAQDQEAVRTVRLLGED